jgi:hypothetical protein
VAQVVERLPNTTKKHKPKKRLQYVQGTKGTKQQQKASWLMNSTWEEEYQEDRQKLDSNAWHATLYFVNIRDQQRK